jgi:hypothetical protein
MNQGAYIDSMQSGSVAERAGLKPGMVISHVNGIALAGLGDAMPRILEASEGQIRLLVIGGANYVLQPLSVSAAPVSGKGEGRPASGNCNREVFCGECPHTDGCWERRRGC